MHEDVIKFFQKFAKIQKLSIFGKVSSSSIQLYRFETDSAYMEGDITAFFSKISCNDKISHLLPTLNLKPPVLEYEFPYSSACEALHAVSDRWEI